MGSFDTLQPDITATGVPGAFSQQHTTFAYELDIEKLREESQTTPEALDEIAVAILPRGFTILSGFIEVVVPPTDPADHALATTITTFSPVGLPVVPLTGVDDIINVTNQNRIYSTVDDTDPEAAGNVFKPITLIQVSALNRSLNFLMYGGEPLADGVFIIGVTGIYLHGRAAKTIAKIPPVL